MYKFLLFPYFIFFSGFQFLNHDFIIDIYFTHISALNTVNDSHKSGHTKTLNTILCSFYTHNWKYRLTDDFNTSNDDSWYSQWLTF